MDTQPSSDRAERLFYQALDLPEEAAEVFLKDACGGDGDLRAEVESLLRFYRRDEKFLQDAAPLTPEVEAELARLKPEQAGDRIGYYKLLEQIGEGGFGKVWVAEQEKPIRRRVALKIIKLGMDTRDVVARFEQERQALALMDHPNIAKVLDAGATLTGRPFFVMELVHGIKITDYCDEAQLPTSERLKLFVQVCQAVQHAHQKGIIHRDLKPSNVLVTMHDGVPTPKVIDFGVAKATQQQRFTDLTIYTQFQQMVGTPLYMAPEQAEMSGLDIDTRSDIYSLGVVLYELLTGRTPSDPEKLLQAGYDEMRRIIREEEPPKPSTVLSTMAADTRKKVARYRHSEEAKLVSSVQGDLDWIVMKALEKDRSRRYDTAIGLARDIERHLASEPVSARPPSAGYRFRRFIRRNRVLAGASAAVLFALALGLGVSTFLFLAEQRQRRIADAATHAAEEQRQLAISNERYGRRLLYAADINLAQQALELGNLSRARMLLDRHRPDVGAEDLRGWEWRLLWKHCRTGGFKVLPRPKDDAFSENNAAYEGRPGSPYSISYSHDGCFLAIGYTEGHVELWDAKSDKFLRTLQTVYTVPADMHYERVGRVSFSPVANLLAATGGHGELKIWDVTQGSATTLNHKFIDVRDLAFSADGSLLAVLYKRGEVVVLNVDSHEVLYRFSGAVAPLNMHFGNIRLSPDGELLYVATEAQAPAIACYSLAKKEVSWKKPVGYVLDKANPLTITAIAVSPNGKLLATAMGFKSSSIQVWDAMTGEKVSLLEGHSRWVSDLDFSPDGKSLVSASADQSLRIWSTDTWREEVEPLRGHGDEVWSVALRPNSLRIAAGGKNGQVLIWNMEGRGLSDGRISLPADIEWIHPLPGGELLLAAENGNRLSIFNPASGNDSQLLLPRDIPGWLMEPNYLARKVSESRLQVFEIASVGLSPAAEAPISPDEGTPLVFSPVKRLLAWKRDGETMVITDCDHLERSFEIETEPGTILLVFSADGRFLLGSTPSGAARVWDLRTKSRLFSAERYLSPFDLPLGNNYLRINETLQKWLAIAVESGERLAVRADERVPRGWLPAGHFGDRALAPDGHTFAVSTGTAQVAFYDARGARKLFTLRGRSSAAYCLAFSPDGTRLAVPGNVLWDIATFQELMALPSMNLLDRYAEWTDDGNTLISGKPGFPGSFQLWHAPEWEEINRAEKGRVLWSGD